ncbi:MAG TPA: hypothetical protein PLX89_17735 [Verrucomicrobiota bacterium]|nr:hypothetical protein [Verrucomicrobiales bacterium]HRI14841.1 hypothetical protein [Verrucomicrobiota bacterium]
MNFVRSLPSSTALLTGAVVATASLSAQESPYDLEKSGWYVRTGAYIQSGLSLSVTRALPVPVITPGVYDDGFVQEDISQGAAGLTWNWGYLSETQLVDGTVEFHRVEGLATVPSLSGFGDDMLYGPEILVGFEFYHFQIKRHEARFGFELGFRYGTASGSAQGTVQSDVTLRTDRYDLGGVVPPLPPYVGFPDLAGPLISLTPQPQPTQSAIATTTLATSMQADFYTARFGAWMSVVLNEKWTVGVSAGLTSIYADGNAQFTETRRFDNAAFQPVTRTASNHNGDWLPGVYFQLRASYWFRPWIGAYVTAEWAHNGDMVIDGLEYQAMFDFGSTYGASAGVQFSF